MIAWKLLRVRDGLLLSAVTRAKGFEIVYSMGSPYDGVMAFSYLEAALQFASGLTHTLRKEEIFALWKVRVKEGERVGHILPPFFFSRETEADDFLRKVHAKWLRDFKKHFGDAPPPNTILCNGLELYMPVIYLQKNGSVYCGPLFKEGGKVSVR